MLKNSMLFVAILAVTVSFTSRASAQTPKEITEGELQTRTNEIVVARKTLADNMSAQTTADSDLTRKKKRLEAVETGLKKVEDAKTAYDTAFEAKKTAEDEWEAGRRVAASGASVPGLAVAEADARGTLAALENADESLRETVKKVCAKLKLSTFTLDQPITILLSDEAIAKLTEEKNAAQTAVDEAQTAATNAATAVSSADTTLKDLQRNFLLELGPTVYQREVIARQQEQLAVQQALLEKLVEAASKPTPAILPVTNVNVDLTEVVNAINAITAELGKTTAAVSDVKTEVAGLRKDLKTQSADAIARIVAALGALKEAPEEVKANAQKLDVVVNLPDELLKEIVEKMDRIATKLEGETTPSQLKAIHELIKLYIAEGKSAKEVKETEVQIYVNQCGEKFYWRNNQWTNK